MAAPAWFWPASGASARGVSIVPYGQGLAVPDWTTPTLWPFSPASQQFSSGLTLATGTPGLVDADSDGASGLWALSWAGNFWRVLNTGAIAATGTLPATNVYVGCAAPGGVPYFVAASGQVYTSGAVQLGVWPTPAWFLGSSGTTLAALLPASGIGLMSTSTGATGRIALPTTITTPACLAFSAGHPLAIGGWQTAQVLQGAAASALDPADATAMVGVGVGQALLWRAPSLYSEQWTVGQTLTGLTTLTSLAWRPDGTQILATSPSSGVVQVITDTAGVLSLTQTFTLASATSVVVAGDSVHALVAQSGATQVVPLTATGGVWAVGSLLSVFSGVATLAAFGTAGAVGTYGAGLAFFNLINGVWSLGNTIALPFSPTVVTTDNFNTVYTAGSGGMAVIANNVLIGSGTWGAGIPTGIAAHQGRVLLAVPSNNALYIFGQNTPTSWSQQGSGALAQGATVRLALSTAQLFSLGSGSTVVQGFSGTPFVLTPIRAGAASLWNGSAWTTATLGIGHVPSACSFDVSGNLIVATIQNTLWTISASGSVISSGSVQTYSGQTQSVPMGVSALLAAGGGVYAATSISGVLTQVK